MSFLNPVSEPVLRFKSTDASAPQINYNARTAGDVKAVLKACLVTGYGAKASAGWSIVNEVDHVAEFVSPSVAMSDYRLGINDTSASSTTWYYQYQDVRTNPINNTPGKSFNSITKTSAENGWQLFVTDRGIIFVELVYHTSAAKLSARITYWGQVKSALIDTVGKNMMFFNIGHDAAIGIPHAFYNSSNQTHLNLGTHASAWISAATSYMLDNNAYLLDSAYVDLSSQIYIASRNKDLIIAELPSLLSKVVNNSADVFGVSESLLDGRNVVSVCAGYSHQTASVAKPYTRTFLIRTDYWEY